MIDDHDVGSGVDRFSTFAVIYGVAMVAFAALVVIVLVLLIRYLLVATRAARLYVETHQASATGVEPPPATNPAVRTRKPKAT